MKFVSMCASQASSVASGTLRAIAILSPAAVAALLLAAAVCPAQDALARFIPPDAPVIAGMQSTGKDNAYDRLWLATAKNLVDLRDFISLTDADDSRRFDRVIVTASPDGNDPLGNHLLIAEGRFDSSAITQPNPQAVIALYRVRVLVFSQASGSDVQTRWLATLHNRIALFGSASVVQRALLRYQSGAAADTSVQARLARIPSNDVAWSSIALNPEILRSRLRLNKFEGNFVPCLTAVNELTLGERFNANAHVDLRILANTPQDADNSIACLNQATNRVDFISLHRIRSGSSPLGGMSIEFKKDEYSRWVDTFRHHSDELLLAAAAPYSPTTAASYLRHSTIQYRRLHDFRRNPITSPRKADRQSRDYLHRASLPLLLCQPHRYSHSCSRFQDSQSLRQRRGDARVLSSCVWSRSSKRLPATRVGTVSRRT